MSCSTAHTHTLTPPPYFINSFSARTVRCVYGAQNSVCVAIRVVRNKRTDETLIPLYTYGHLCVLHVQCCKAMRPTFQHCKLKIHDQNNSQHLQPVHCSKPCITVNPLFCPSVPYNEDFRLDEARRLRVGRFVFGQCPGLFLPSEEHGLLLCEDKWIRSYKSTRRDDQALNCRTTKTSKL